MGWILLFIGISVFYFFSSYFMIQTIVSKKKTSWILSGINVGLAVVWCLIYAFLTYLTDYNPILLILVCLLLHFVSSYFLLIDSARRLGVVLKS